MYKFGGTSIANAKNIKLVLDIVLNKAKKDKLIVVVSALSKVTDLLQLAASKATAVQLSQDHISQLDLLSAVSLGYPHDLLATVQG